MIVDLHSHYIPPQAVRDVPGVPVELEQLAGGRYRFVARGNAFILDQALFDLESQVRDARRQGLDARALAVPPFALLYELPAEAGIAWSRALNDGIAAAVRSDPATFLGFATVPLQDVGLAVAELDRVVQDLGLQGVEIATNICGSELDAPQLDPFWARVEAFGLPVLIHPHHVPGVERMRDYYLRNLVGNPVETALAAARLAFGGVLERYPGLRLILSHGGGALPSLVGRLAHGFAVRTECKGRASAPMASLRRLHYDTVVFDPRVLRHLVDTFGPAQVVLGTDYPFDMSLDAPVEFVRGAGLRPEEVDLILNSSDRLVPSRMSKPSPRE